MTTEDFAAVREQMQEDLEDFYAKLEAGE